MFILVMKGLILILLLTLTFDAIAQDSIPRRRRDYGYDVDTVPKLDLIDIFSKTFHIHSKKMPKKGDKKVYYSLVPIPTNIPGGGVALITSTNAAFYMGPRASTNLSNVSFAPSFSFRGRFSFSFYSNIWLTGNKDNVTGDMRFIINPQYTWGLGKGVPNDQKELLYSNYFRFYQTWLHKIDGGKWMAGLGYMLDWYSAIRFTNNDSVSLAEFSHYEYGTQSDRHSVSSGLTLNVQKDARQNSINPQAGYYFSAVLRYNFRWLGSTDKWPSLYVDYRRYLHFGDTRSQNVLAFWGYYWTALSNKTPYLDLPSIGWDPTTHSGRGITQNRYRGKGLLDLEAEYRRDITRNGFLGFVVFANMNAVTELDDYRFTAPHPAVGTGLRIKFNKRSNTNIAFDYGISKSGSRFSMMLGEAF